MVILYKDDGVTIKATKISLKGIFDEAISKLGNELITVSKKHLNVNNTIYTGEIEDTIKFTTTKKGGRVRYDSNHANWIEFGTSPTNKNIPIAPLEEWVNKKLGISGKRGKDFAFNLSKRIKATGIKPQPFIYPSIYNVKNSQKRL